LAKPNYSFEKRQREIAKKKEKDAKDARKREAREASKPASGADEGATADGNSESSPGA
jgi:parvulin-like peptidyl-prolyl isomerase